VFTQFSVIITLCFQKFYFMLHVFPPQAVRENSAVVTKFPQFSVLLTVHLDNTCNENQLDALFILSLFRQSTSTCFGHICSPSSRGILYVYNWYLCVLFDSLLATTTESQLESTTRTSCCIYMVYRLKMD